MFPLTRPCCGGLADAASPFSSTRGESKFYEREIRFQSPDRGHWGPKSRVINSSSGQDWRWVNPVSMIQGFASELTKSAYNCHSVMTCEGQANLALRQSIHNRAHGHLRNDSFRNRCWDNRDAYAGIDERDDCRHLSCCLDHLRDDSSVTQNSSQKIMESRSVFPCVQDKWIPFEFAQTNLFLCGKRVP